MRVVKKSKETNKVLYIVKERLGLNLAIELKDILTKGLNSWDRERYYFDVEAEI